jgi:hypothetical protein
MGLNVAVEQAHLPEIQALLVLLERFLSKWQGASTLERRLDVEAEIVATFERLLEMDLKFREVEVGEHPEFTELRDFYTDYEYLLRVNTAKVQQLASTFLRYFNTQQIVLHELTGQMKRIRQKQAALSLWNRDKAKYVLAEHFLTLDALDTVYTSVMESEIDTNQGILTLPVRNKESVRPSSVKVGSGSNGNPGSSDPEVTTNNTDPNFATNGNAINWFEYERLDSGPCELTLVLQYSQPQVINNLYIEPINLGTSIPFEIEDIIFTVSGRTQVSIHDLLSGGFDKDFFTVKTVGADTGWSVTFLPVSTTAISIKLRQSQAYQIEVVTSDDRRVLRDRYAIGLRSIQPYRLRYEREGGINTKVLEIPGGLYATLPVADVWPPTQVLYDTVLEVSQDGGQTWSVTDLLPPPDSGEFSVGEGALDTTDPRTVLLDGEASDFIWRLTVGRQDNAFSHVTSFIEDAGTVVDPTTLLRTVNRFRSPTDISLPSKPKDGSVGVIQPKVARRGSGRGGVFIGRGGGQATSFPMPFSIIRHGVDPDEVRVFVARQEYERVGDNLLIGPNQWGFSDDFEEILFADILPDDSAVRVLLDEELMVLEERSDGYYHKLDFLFDPDKENMEIKYLPRNAERVSFLLPRKKTVIDLGYKNIEDDSFVITSRDGTVFNQVLNRADVFDNQDADYYLDSPNGVLYLARSIGETPVKVTFNHWAETLLSRDSYEAVIENNVPVAVRISKEAFFAVNVRERINGGLFKRIDVRTGRFAARDAFIRNTETSRQLSYDCVVIGTFKVPRNLFIDTSLLPQEVDFIDGHTEFLGLIPMNREFTVEIDSGGDQFVTFALSARALWYQPFGVVFSNSGTFATLVGSAVAAETGSVGDYFVDEEGIVTVNVGVGSRLAEDIAINYYYRDPTFDPANRYSVDYKNGALYSYSELRPGAFVEYKATCYKIAYDIAKRISSSQYNAATNTVAVRTEGLNEINSLVKVIYTEATQAEGFRELKDFFSPIISVLAFRFT